MPAFDSLPASLYALRTARDELAAKTAAKLEQYDAGIRAIELLLGDEETGVTIAQPPTNTSPPIRVRPNTLHSVIVGMLTSTPNMKVAEIARGLKERGYDGEERTLQNSVSRVLSMKPGFTRGQDRRWSLISGPTEPSQPSQHDLNDRA